MPAFLIPFYGTSMISREPISLKTSARAVIPLLSSLSLLAENLYNFNSLFSFNASAIISPPSGPSPQLSTFKTLSEDIVLRKKSKLLIPFGPNALSLRLRYSISLS
jgi:hypothetical protein